MHHRVSINRNGMKKQPTVLCLDCLEQMPRFPTWSPNAEALHFPGTMQRTHARPDAHSPLKAESKTQREKALMSKQQDK
jgi:hypothetical protein